ncbi:MAG: GH92 family glycosyl hydrolase [Oscillospiraceae bacterium]|nr:GH92 family glycosyl hydrolase [Oscillospiraceae bacterium]
MKYLPYVNIKQGSASVHRFSNGNTLPLTALPFAMANFAPQTNSSSSWFFHPADRCIEGIRLTHQPSPWIADYGSLIFFPQKFKPEFSASDRWSGYRPENAELMPNYMKLELLRSRCVFELTPAERGGAIRVHFNDEKENYFSLLPLEGGFTCDYRAEKDAYYITVDNCCDENAVNFKMFAVIKFGKGQISGINEYAENRGVHLSVSGKELNALVSTSYISFEQAELNFKRDFENRNFDKIKSDAESIWESCLSRVQIEAFDEKQMKTFYSCMYRAFLYPHKCYELDENNKPVHYCPFDGTVKSGVRYTDNGFWDTYRTVYPFFSLVAKDEYKEMCEGFINDYLECGWLPRWPSIGERGCMPSTLLDAVLCDAAVKGILTGKNLETALEGMLKHANVNSENDDYGRSGAESYVKLGYVPIEAHKESVNLTLDASYGDWCIAKIAEILGKDDLASEYHRRAKNYKNLFDKETGFMRPKFENGEFRPDFSPTAWGRDYTEGSAWQNSFAVPHDIEGLASLYGGKEELIKKIDELFAASPDYEVVGYSCEIHEMTEMAAADFGQCAISNQPSFHIPYIYSALGDVEKTSYWVQKICEEAFSFEDDGFPGDEDNGTMALWYVFSSIGIYPFCPGKKEFVRTKKLVKSVRINGKVFDADSFTGNKIEYDCII